MGLAMRLPAGLLDGSNRLQAVATPDTADGSGVTSASCASLRLRGDSGLRGRERSMVTRLQLEASQTRRSPMSAPGRYGKTCITAMTGRWWTAGLEQVT